MSGAEARGDGGNGREPGNLDVLIDLDDAFESLSNAGSDLGSMGLAAEARRAFELADQIRELHVALRREHGRV